MRIGNVPEDNGDSIGISAPKGGGLHISHMTHSGGSFLNFLLGFGCYVAFFFQGTENI